MVVNGGPHFEVQKSASILHKSNLYDTRYGFTVNKGLPKQVIHT